MVKSQFAKRVIIYVCLSLILFSGCSSHQPEHKKIIIKFASVSPPSNPIMKTFLFIKNEIEKRSAGDIVVELYDSGRLGGETDNVERIRLGTMEMTDVATSVLGNFMEKFFVFDLPFLFNNQEHQYNVLSGKVGNLLRKKLEDIGIKGMAFYGIGTRNIYTKKSVKRIEDINGLKIRVMESKIMLETINSLGAHAIPMSFSELYNALQQDVVDGAENNPFQYLASGHADLCKYFALTEHFMVPEILLMSLKFYNNLKPKYQQIINEVVEDSKTFHQKHWQALEEQTFEKLNAAGAEVTSIDKAPFKERVKSIYEQFEKKYGRDLIQMIEEENVKSCKYSNKNY